MSGERKGEHHNDARQQDEAKGKFHEVKGKVKEKIGRATKDPRLEDEGTSEKTHGKLQKKAGQVAKVLEP